ncbi:dehydrodolichyl diphosphate synthase complex subunit Nus1 [Amborella trichopoda]|uniref:dehydrodolichyl diphosphate synthase complex subunit Nus1 n=1 Tax=Amborella trichopoda TaxID=13333 RepID=UPI0005D33A30|nr:dehydrodolichyl diphosphate synthase complex subunit Nus1 [Amborella trichopoda]|eukprot:XP_011627681.1 dehydrodolichyl diphosphate synthase complex subunit Nus1 [Amborella trichopoda]
MERAEVLNNVPFVQRISPVLVLERYGVLRIILSVLWNLIHLIVSVIHFAIRMANKLQHYVILTGLLKKYKSIDLRKLQHMAIVIESEEATQLTKVYRLLYWLSYIGVHHVTLYDMDGVLKESKKFLSQNLRDLSIKAWQEAEKAAAFLDKKVMTLEILSFSDSKEAVAKAGNYLLSTYPENSGSGGQKIEMSITEDDLGKALCAAGFGGPEPDLLFVFGPARCHLGFPAWRLRYTEIVHMGRLKSLKYGAVVKAILDYSVKNQNYGT